MDILAAPRRTISVLLVVTTILTAGSHRGNAVAVADEAGGEPAEEADPAEVAVGERLFLETRFAQHFFALSGGDVNAAIPADPVMDSTVTPTDTLPGPFAGQSMNCRACHLVDEQGGVPGAGNRTYTDFARRSPVPARQEDSQVMTVRNSPPLVNASLRRRNFFLHFDGEFASVEELVVETLLGRNFGWLPTERRTAIHHIARVIRKDDGQGELAQSFGGPYAILLRGIDPSIPPELKLPRRFRIDVRHSSDMEILVAVARLIGAYVKSLEFTRDDSGAFSGSPYDAFLIKNNLPRQPAPGETDTAYSRRLRARLDRLSHPRFVTPADGALRLHDQPFVFGALELTGLKTFLAEPGRLPLTASTLAAGRIGNCIACHPAPNFTDFGLHNTGVAQSEYDAIHGRGAFMALYIPGLRTRNHHFDAYLPPSANHPDALGPFRSVPDAARPGLTDLGVWNIYANPDVPRSQLRLQALLCDRVFCAPDDVLTAAVARFKTAGLRDLGHSGPYLHTGRADTLEAVLGLYAHFSALARAGTMRNPAPELNGMALTGPDIAALAAFLRSLNEDYE
jgi:hypothetical protein